MKALVDLIEIFILFKWKCVAKSVYERGGRERRMETTNGARKKKRKFVVAFASLSLFFYATIIACLDPHRHIFAYFMVPFPFPQVTIIWLLCKSNEGNSETLTVFGVKSEVFTLQFTLFTSTTRQHTHVYITTAETCQLEICFTSSLSRVVRQSLQSCCQRFRTKSVRTLTCVS